MNKLPIMALRYAKDLCNQLGMCGEVFLTAYCIYAELEEHLPKSPDSAYAYEPNVFYDTMVSNARASTWIPKGWKGEQ